jgi:putative ABC transport system permease protein
MLALSLRGIATRKLRTALTAFAVVLGVALVSGTYMLTDTIDKSFDEVFTTANRGVDVVVTPKRLFDADMEGAAVQPEELRAALLDAVRRVPGVALAAGSVFLPGQIYDQDDEPLITTGAPMFITDTNPARFDPFEYEEGHPPRGPREMAIDKGSADRAGFELGDMVRLSGEGPQEAFRLVGIAKFGEENSLAGAAIAIVSPPEAQRLLGLRDEFTQISVAAAPGTTPGELARAITATLPRDEVTVRTGEQQARSDSEDIKDQLGFLRTFLFVFAGIALFVGAFLIANTFSITVAQRVREFALLRMIGANRRQVLRAVIGEALVIGVLASIVGFFAGFAMAPALNALFKLFGAELPSTGIVLETRTVIVSILIGTIITLLSALVPAVRATRVPPIAALQEAASLPRGRAARWRTPLASVVSLLGVALMCLGLFGSASGGDAAGLVGAGAAVIFIGVGMLAQHIVTPLALAVGKPLEGRRGRIAPRLARENAQRNPRRTASTSAALMIGVAFVAFVTIFAAGLKASIADAVDVGLRGQLIAQTTNFQPVPVAARATLQEVEGVGTVSGVRFSRAIVAGEGRPTVTGVDPATIGEVFNLDWDDGSAATLRALGPGEALLATRWAEDHGLTVGDTLSVTSPTGARLDVEVTGIYDDEANLLANLTLPNEVLLRDFNVRGDAFLMATASGDVEAVKARADRAMRAAFPSVEVLTKDEFIGDQEDQINQLLALVYVLLALTLLIALFGVLNTLFLTIHERTRELGMLRAIGTSRRQVKRMVRYESVITSMIGAVLGVVLGAIFAVLVTIPLESEGFKISIPIGQLVILLILAAVFGVIAAIAPARRAARLDVLRALAYE